MTKPILGFTQAFPLPVGLNKAFPVQESFTPMLSVRRFYVDATKHQSQIDFQKEFRKLTEKLRTFLAAPH